MHRKMCIREGNISCLCFWQFRELPQLFAATKPEPQEHILNVTKYTAAFQVLLKIAAVSLAAIGKN